jgi:hypothetical protein
MLESHLLSLLYPLWYSKKVISIFLGFAPKIEIPQLWNEIRRIRNIYSDYSGFERPLVDYSFTPIFQPISPYIFKIPYDPERPRYASPKSHYLSN